MDDKQIIEKITHGIERKEEIFYMEEFISRYTSDEKYDDYTYREFFNLLNEKISMIYENNPDYLYMLKILQTIRLLSRNKNIQKILFENEKIIFFENLLENLIRKNLNNEIMDNIYIEIISIIKRYFVLDNKNIFYEKLISSNLIDHLIFLLHKENIIIIKLLHVVFISVLSNEEIIIKFVKTYTVENMIMCIRDKGKEFAKLILDFLVILLENKDFRNLFLFLEGHLMLLNKLKSINKIEKDIILKILHNIQIIYKNEETLKGENAIVINNLLNILNSNTDFQINKHILNILSAFALYDDLNIMIRMNWLESLIKNLVDYSFKMKKTDGEERNYITHNQALITRILRLIFSLEKNRKYFKHLFPTKILGIFIDIGNYKHCLSLYNCFIEELNSLPEYELLEILQKNENINKENDSQIIGGYTIVELIGKGGFGSVYKVKLGSQYFAMKMIKLEEEQLKIIKDKGSLEEIERAISEILIWKDLDHPNIIKYHTSFIEKGHAYIILELVEGVNLSEYIINLREKSSKPKEEAIIKILIDTICAFKYLHKEKGILYRDVNPHNIMLDNNFNVKLGDFGLAQIMGLDQSLNAFAGSILYSSPEIVKNQAYTEKSDIWSLGCIIYELLCLKPPFEGDNPLTVTKNIVELNYKRLNINDYEIKKLPIIVDKCLQMNTDERIDVTGISDILGDHFVDKINLLKKNEMDLKNENEILREKIYKLELAFTTNNNLNDEYITKIKENISNKDLLESKNKITDSNFKHSIFKRISDPLTKILDMINKILYLSEMHNNVKDEKYTFINKFKRKLFSNRDNWNANLVKTEIIKLINFSKECINFEIEERFEPFNSTGMKPFKTRVTYETLYHYIEELLIANKYYENK